MNNDNNYGPDLLSISLDVADHVPAMLAYWDNNLLCHFANAAYIEWFGKTREEMVHKMTLIDLLGPIYELNKPYIEAALAGKVQTFERIFNLPNNTHRYSQANYIPKISNGKVNGFFVLVYDITDLKKLEQRLSDSEQRFRHLLENAPDSVVIINGQGEIEMVNAQTEKMFGFLRTQLLGMKIESILKTETNRENNLLTTLSEPVIGYEQGGWHRLIELLGQNANGITFPVEASIGQIVQQDGLFYSLSIRDISVRKNQERELLDLASIIASSFDAIVSTTLDGIILSWNKGAEAILGYTVDEMRGKSVKVLFPEELEREEDYLISRILNGENISHYATKRLAKNGNEVHVSLSISPIKNAADEIVGISKIFRDITQQKLTEEALRESNRRNMIFVEQSPNSIAMFDKEMNYLAASGNWYKDLFITGKDIIGQSHYDVFPEISPEWKMIHQAGLRGEIVKNDEDLFLRADGREQWLSWEVRPWYIREGEIGGIIINLDEITDRKMQEREKRAIEEILDKTNEIARIGTWEVDLVNNKINWSRITREIHEVPNTYHPEMVSAINFYKEGYSRDTITKVLTNSIENGTTFDVELQLVTGIGNEVWVRAIGQPEFKNGKCERVIGVFQNIDEVKTARLSLDKLNEELKSLLNAGYVSIIGTDPDGLITHFNRGAEELLQYSAAEMIGIHTPAIIHLESEVIKRGEELTAQFNKPIAGFDAFVELARRGEYESREWTYIRKDGTHFPVQLVVTSVRNKVGEITGFIGVGTDISEIKNAQKETKALLEITTDQNERLKNFAHIVSHNLRSHTGNIDMLLDIYLEENPDALQNEYLSLTKKAMGNLKETIANLNEVVAMNTSVGEELVPLNLFAAVEKAKTDVNQVAKEAGVHIFNQIDPKAVVLGYPAYLDSVLLNFITNGIKYRSNDRQAEIVFSANKSGKFVIVKIADNGKGIDLKRNGSKLFGMYKTFHGNKDARGIGLFITKNQVEAMGGKIEVESEPNRGTTFSLFLKHEKI